MTAGKPSAAPFVQLTEEQFDGLKCGDVLVNEAADKAYFINQVRLPGFYVVAAVDPKTYERTERTYSILRSGKGFALAPKKN
jgi:hypothetical protein